MKKYLLVLAMVLMFAVSASAYPLIKIGSGSWYDLEVSLPPGNLVYGVDYWTIDDHPANPTSEEISNWVNGGGELFEVYKQNVGETGDTGQYASSYFTEFVPPIDPSGAELKWVFSTGVHIEVDGVPAYLVVKDGNAIPAIYIFDLGELGWNGMDTIYLREFWPNSGAISYISIYDPPSNSEVPEPSTMLFLGSGLIGLAGYGRKKFFKK